MTFKAPPPHPSLTAAAMAGLLAITIASLGGCASDEEPVERATTVHEVAAQQPEPTEEVPTPEVLSEAPPKPDRPSLMAKLLDQPMEGPLALSESLQTRWRQWQHVGGDQTLLVTASPGGCWPPLGDSLLTVAENLPSHGISPQLLTPGLLEDLILLRSELLLWDGWTEDDHLDLQQMELMVTAEQGLVRLWLELARLLDAVRPIPGERVVRDEGRMMDAIAIWDGDPQLVGLLTPPLVAYDRMSAALVRYQGIGDSGGFVELPKTKAYKRARPKRRHKELPLLRQRLTQEDLLGAGQGEIWDEELTEALKRAREAHQLPRRKGRKLLDNKLLKALAVPVDQRLRSLERNLNRLRNSPLRDQPYAIYVNLPDFHGEVWDGPELLHRFKVVIGNRKKDEGRMVNATPTLTGRVRAAIYNPYWNVPRRIYEEELLPESEEWVAKELAARQAAAAALETAAAQGAEGATGTEETTGTETATEGPSTPQPAPVPPPPIAPPETDDGEANPTDAPNYWVAHKYDVMFPDNPRRMYVRRRPGPGNALGKVKLIFDNRYSVFLHDTPAKGKFHHARRAFSHGCMRVDKPLDLARLLLERDGTWPIARRYKVLRHEDRTQINLRKQVWLVVDYVTARVADDGRVHWLMDVYGHDRKRLAER